MCFGSRGLVLLAWTIVLMGCQSTSTVHVPDVTQSSVRPAPELKSVKPKSLEPDVQRLPMVDALAIRPRPVFADGAGSFRGLTLQECWVLAVRYSPAATLLEQENSIPDCRPSDGSRSNACRSSAYELVRQARLLWAKSERNKAAAEALVEFYQLADVEGRSEQLQLGTDVLDKYLELVKKTVPSVVAPIPVPAVSELVTQRTQSAKLAVEAEKGVRLLNLDLKRRLGLPGDTTYWLWPDSDFGIHSGLIDTEALVQVGLESHPELQLLRLTYLGLTPGTLPTVKELIRGAGVKLGPGPIAGLLVRPQPIATALTHFLNPPPDPDPCLVQEVAIRKQQLFDLIAEKERGVADDIRSKVILLESQAKQVGIARWKLDDARKKFDEVARGKGNLVEYPATIQLHALRAELIDAVMGWHAARVKLLEAQGLLAEPQESLNLPARSGPRPIGGGR